jgi:hypothetical protein
VKVQGGFVKFPPNYMNDRCTNNLVFSNKNAFNISQQMSFQLSKNDRAIHNSLPEISELWELTKEQCIIFSTNSAQKMEGKRKKKMAFKSEI